jgi:hypothetical protein
VRRGDDRMVWDRRQIATGDPETLAAVRRAKRTADPLSVVLLVRQLALAVVQPVPEPKSLQLLPRLEAELAAVEVTARA